MILVMATFIMLASMFVSTIAGGQESSAGAGLHSRAAELAREGLDAVRNMRDESWDNLTVGTHGLAVSGGRYVFSGNSDTTNGFTRTITLTDITSDTKQAVSTITWKISPTRNGQISLTSKLTDWHAAAMGYSGHFIIDFSHANLSGDNKEVRDVNFINTLPVPITVTDATYTWNRPTSLVERMRMETNTVWSKVGPGTPLNSQPSGTVLDIVDFTIPANSTIEMDNLKFTQRMDGTTVGMFIHLNDGSTAQTTHDF